MPQATDKQRIDWGGEGGVGDDKAINHLLSKGFAFTRGGTIESPPGFDFTEDTTDCGGAIDFLCDEWDYDYRYIPAKPCLNQE